MSQYDQEAHARLAGVSDLIAAEGKYHPNCFKRFQRGAARNKQNSDKTDLAMEWLINEIRKSANKRHVIQLSEVWNRYCELAIQADVEVPASFKSRRGTFKEKRKNYVQESYDFVTVPNEDVLLVGYPGNLHMYPFQRKKNVVQSLHINLLMRDS